MYDSAGHAGAHKIQFLDVSDRPPWMPNAQGHVEPRNRLCLNVLWGWARGESLRIFIQHLFSAGPCWAVILSLHWAACLPHASSRQPAAPCFSSRTLPCGAQALLVAWWLRARAEFISQLYCFPCVTLNT